MDQVWRRRGLAGVLVGFALAGCGFRPIYAPSADRGVSDELAAIEVPILGDRNGQVFRQALIERLERSGGNGGKRYDLVISYSVSSESIATQADSTGSRTRLTASATWSLVTQDQRRRTIVSGSSRSVDGYDPIDSQYFSSDLNSEAVQRRLAQQVAEQVVLRLAVALRERGGASSGGG